MGHDAQITHCGPTTLPYYHRHHLMSSLVHEQPAILNLVQLHRLRAAPSRSRSGTREVNVVSEVNGRLCLCRVALQAPEDGLSGLDTLALGKAQYPPP